jgi:hypothetical protein
VPLPDSPPRHRRVRFSPGNRRRIDDRDRRIASGGNDLRSRNQSHCGRDNERGAALARSGQAGGGSPARRSTAGLLKGRMTKPLSWKRARFFLSLRRCGVSGIKVDRAEWGKTPSPLKRQNRNSPNLNRLSKSAAGAITLECKRAPRPPGFASVETLDDARPDIQLRRRE